MALLGCTLIDNTKMNWYLCMWGRLASKDVSLIGCVWMQGYAFRRNSRNDVCRNFCGKYRSYAMAHHEHLNNIQKRKDIGSVVCGCSCSWMSSCVFDVHIMYMLHVGVITMYRWGHFVTDFVSILFFLTLMWLTRSRSHIQNRSCCTTRYIACLP